MRHLKIVLIIYIYIYISICSECLLIEENNIKRQKLQILKYAYVMKTRK